MKYLKLPFLTGLILAEVLMLISIQLLFSRLEAQQGRAVTTIIGSLLRDESTMSRSYLLAQSLEDMHTYGQIKCASLKRITGKESTAFYDSTFREDCPKGHLQTVVMPGLDGNQWSLQLAPNIDLSFYILKWLTLLGSATLLLIAYMAVIRLFAREKKKQESLESRRRFLEELTQKVGHDVASPMSALKVIAERAPLDEETKSFLHAAITRTEGIFNTLKSHRSDERIVHVDKEILKIVEEKKLSRENFPKVNVDLSPIALQLPAVEFSRMISNLLDNAHEAGAKAVRIYGNSTATTFTLHVNDDGHPLPESVRENFGVKGNTFGKAAGSGLGLFQSTQFMRSVGGRLVASENPGEKIAVIFPSSLLR